MGAQKSYIDTSSAQVTALWVFSFRGVKKLKGGIHDSTPKNTVKRNSERESEKKFGESETFYRSKFSRPTGVSPSAQE